MSVSLTIASTERKGVVDFNPLRRKNRINEEADQLTFELLYDGDTRNYKPTVNDEVVFTIDGTREFGGVIVRIDEELESPKLARYKVTCNDYAFLLNRQLVTENYTNTTIDAIIADIIANDTTGFTGNNVNAPVEVTSISFNRLTPAQCFQKLAEKANYSWYVDYSKDVHFFAKNGEAAPFNLTDDDTDADYAKYVYMSLVKEDDISQLRNTILVEGGEKEGVERTITRDGSDVSDEGVLDLQYKFSEKPTVTVDTGGGAVTQTVGIDFLDDDGSFDVMWNFNEKYLRFTSGNIPSSGDVIAMTGNPLFPIIVNVPDNDSVQEFGTFEFAIRDRTIRSEDEAIDRAIAEITAYGDSIVEGSFKTYNSGLRAGQVLTINDTFRGITDERVLIQSVDLKCITPTGDRLEHNVKFATFKTIGIINFLQNQLRDREISEQELETLLSFLRINDSASTSDSIDTPTTTTGPYYWSPVTGGNQDFKWGFGHWQ